tara:strand:- start:180 stop:1091 length:912 start_codon:yes stop_codon:yes gene_type:complete
MKSNQIKTIFAATAALAFAASSAHAATWTGGGANDQWNNASNWSDSMIPAAKLSETLTIDTTDSINTVARVSGGSGYSGAFVLSSDVNFNKGTLSVAQLFETGGATLNDSVVFNIGDGVAGDAIMNLTAQWTFDRHGVGGAFDYTINVNSDGQLNVSGAGAFSTYANASNVGAWTMNINGGAVNNANAWVVKDNNSEANLINLSGGGTLVSGAITLDGLAGERIDFADISGSSITIAYGGTFNSALDVQNNEMGNTITNSGGAAMTFTDNGTTFTVSTIPEPSVAALLDGCLALTFVMVRRRR